MKQFNYLLMFTLTLSLFSFSAAAEGELKAILEKKDTVESTKKPRRKKVEMCNECGKPEHDCECEGHNEEKKK